jgi:hypothetical protein
LRLYRKIIQGLASLPMALLVSFERKERKKRLEERLKRLERNTIILAEVTLIEE